MNDKVSIVKCLSYNNKEVRKAIEESLKNIDFKFKKNMKILIKPNILSPSKPEQAITTNPVVIEELCRILKEYNAKIYIGDSSGGDTEKAIEVSGIKNLSKYGKILNFDELPKKICLINNIRVPVSRIVFEVDLIINIPKMKTHGFTSVTLCIKNLYGCIPGRIKGMLHKKITHKEELAKFLVELNKTIIPGLNIIDGVEGIEGNGPGIAGEKIKAGLIIAGRDSQKIDIIASEIMGFKKNEVYTNKFSGVKRENISIVGDGKDIKLNFKKPKKFLSGIFRAVYLFFPQSKIAFDKTKCKKCSLCMKKCPVKAIKLNPFPECSSKCIKCLCCIEVCPEGAVYLKDHWIWEIAKYARKKIESKYWKNLKTS